MEKSGRKRLHKIQQPAGKKEERGTGQKGRVEQTTMGIAKRLEVQLETL